MVLLSLVLINSAIFYLSHKEFLSYRIFTIVEGICFGYYLYFIIENQTAKKILMGLGVIFLDFLLLFDLKKLQF